MADAEVRPRIPLALASRPTLGGLVVPWVQVRLADGGADFRSVHHTKWRRAWTEAICQVCEALLEPPVVLLGGPVQLDSYFSEPPLHSWCAAYTAKACPMVAGRMERFADRPRVSDGNRGRKCAQPGCDCDGWVAHPNLSTLGTSDGQPAHAWWAVWCESWSLAVSPDGQLLGGVPVGERRRRLVSSPAGGPM